MISQIIFIISVIIALGFFAFTCYRLWFNFSLTKPFPVKDWGKRFSMMMEVAFGQTKILRKPVIGFLHAIVFWGFCVILIGSIEMIIDGIFGTDRILSFLGIVYDIITASADIFALLIAVAIVAFLFRRWFMHIKRFSGPEMKHKSHQDATVALLLILVLMLSLLGMNIFYINSNSGSTEGCFPVSRFIARYIPKGEEDPEISRMFWWMHIWLIFIFANILPYSKHFHVFMSVPNVLLSRLEPLGKLGNMDCVLSEVKLMMDPATAYAAPAPGAGCAKETFGVKDVEDVTWKNYMDSLTCTECGRCTSVCPANITGKKLSPRKIFMDLRARMKEKGYQLMKNGKDFDDKKAFIRDYITEEELWACTTCNACARECPVNINHPSLIIDMRRYLVMEEGSAPSGLKSIFANIENNGAPWQFSPEDRLNWTAEFKVPLMSELAANGMKPEYLFWVGCAGAFDDRYKKVAAAFAKILSYLKVDFAVLGKEETCTGDPARRAGNEMLYFMQALTVIETLKTYDVKKIITICPHCYNIFKNEYPDLGGNYEVINYTVFLKDQFKAGKLKLDPGIFNGETITYHDPCYLGRANGEYDSPRFVLDQSVTSRKEMKRHKSFALCCGGGGAQYFKEAEKGDKEIFIERTEEAINTGSSIIATACPFCMTMMTDGIKYKNMEEKMKNLDIAEIVWKAIEKGK